MDAYTWLAIVTCEKSPWNYNLHIALMLSNKSYYSLAKFIDMEKFFDVQRKNTDNISIYTVCGVRHNEYHPSYIRYNNWIVSYEEWNQNDQLHRAGGPSCIARYDDGKIKFITWHCNGKLHREDGPAVVNYRNDGTIIHEWYYHGQLHCNDNPAFIKYCEDGTIIYTEWYHYGQITFKTLLYTLIDRSKIWKRIIVKYIRNII